MQFKSKGGLDRVQADAELDANWKQIKITNLKFLRAALIMKHGSLTNATNALGINYLNLSHTIRGRLYLIPIVRAIQEDLGLSDEQVLKLWPLLRVWPREPGSRVGSIHNRSETDCTHQPNTEINKES